MTVTAKKPTIILGITEQTYVFHNEPANPDNEPLANYDNVFFMPHIGGTSSDIAANHTKIITDDVERIFNHETPKFVTNSTTLEKFWEGMDNELS